MKSILCEKELYELSDKIISVTKYMKYFVGYYYQIPEEKIVVINNGINQSNFRILKKEEKLLLKQSLGFNKDEKIVLFSGRLDKEKGLVFLLSAFTEVIKYNENVRLVLAGDDTGHDIKICSYLSYCTNIWSKITFTGFLEYGKMINLYQIADIGIIPSVFDHCPYTVLEMMCHKIPLIISDTEGLNEMLTDSQSIYLFPQINEEGEIIFNKHDIASAIISLLNDDKKVEEITRDYPELTNDRFSVQRMASETYAVLKKLISKTTYNNASYEKN